MSEVRVRNLDEWVVTELRARARRNGRSLEAELRELLRREAMRPKHELADDLHRMQNELRRKYGTFSDSAALIREDRDSRG
jgi:plasmid stability protein